MSDLNSKIKLRVTIETDAPTTVKGLALRTALTKAAHDPRVAKFWKELHLPLLTQEEMANEKILEDHVIELEQEISNENFFEIIKAFIATLPGNPQLTSWDEIREGRHEL